jgi:hypothetical protein
MLRRALREEVVDPLLHDLDEGVGGRGLHVQRHVGERLVGEHAMPVAVAVAVFTDTE